jgi:thymidylate kinase
MWTRRGLAIDGGICAGKTTLRDKLCEEFAYVGIPEYSRYLTSLETELLYTNVERGQFIDAFVRAEGDRYSAFLFSPKAVCLDRSFLTLVAHRFASYRIKLITKSELKYAADVISNSNWIFPDVFIYLKVDDEIRRHRRETRDGETPMPYPLNDDSFNTAFELFFLELARMDLVSLHDNRGDKGIKELATEVVRAHHQREPTSPETIRKEALSLLLSA